MNDQNIAPPLPMDSSMLDLQPIEVGQFLESSVGVLNNSKIRFYLTDLSGGSSKYF